MALAGAATQPDLPPKTTVLAGPAAGFQLPACSRATAGPVDGGWEVEDSHVTAMEAALAQVLPALAERDGYDIGTENPDPLTYRMNDPRWQREIFGITRGGRRILYANFVPADILPDQRHLPTNVCDGGPAFFGVEYDVAAGRISHVAFNGALGGPFWPAYTP